MSVHELHNPDTHYTTTDSYDDPQLTLPGIDGYAVNRIALKVTGSPDLDRSDPGDVTTFRDLKLGQRVRFTVEGYVVDTGGKATMTGTGQVDHVQAIKAVKVDTIQDATIL
jgi:hypothetical protein